MEQKHRVLIVEDDEFNLKILSRDLEGNGYEVVKAEDGKIACDILKNDNNFDVILLDRMMPNMDGITTLKTIKQDERTKNIPIIMQTAAASTKDIQEGVDAGVFFYLTKPYEIGLLLAIVKSAIRDSIKTRLVLDKSNAIYQTYNLIKDGNFGFRTLSDASSLSYLISNFCYEPDKAFVGISELMVNAVEHGNLGISCKEKTELLLTDQWLSEIEKRLQHKSYIDKEALLHFERKKDLIEIIIEDQGNGFDWEPFFEFSIDRSTLPNGRGIAIAKMTSFHSLEYVGKGNKVICRIMAKQP